MKLSEAAIPVRAQRVAVVLCIVAVFALNAAVTWQRWGDLIADTGRELDSPKQLADGKLLYRDVRYWYGPLAPYANALLFRVFGARLEILTAAGLATAAMLGWLSYRLLRRFVDRLAATAGAALVLTTNAFGFYLFPNIFNFVLPYSFPATYGMLLGIASVYFLIRHRSNGQRRDFLVSCGVLALAALCKLEILVATLAAHAAFVFITVRRPLLRPGFLLLGYVGAVIVPVAVFGFFRYKSGPQLWRDNLFLRGNLSASGFVLSHGGLSDLSGSLGALAKSLAALCSVAFAGIVGTWLENRIHRTQPESAANARVSASRAQATAIAIGAATAVSLVIVYAVAPDNMLRALPVLLLAGIIACAFRLGRTAVPSPRGEALAILFVFSLVSILRMGFGCWAGHYGFYLSIPALLSLVIIACGVAPSAFERARSVRPYSPLTVGLGLILAITIAHALERHRRDKIYYPRPDLQVVRARRGTMICSVPYYGSADRALQYLNVQPLQTRVVVLPEGAAITFLSGCENALGMHTFLPLDFDAGYDETSVIRRLAQAPPEYVVYDSRSVEEYGKRAIGVDYGITIANWIRENYRVVETWSTEYFGAQILQRKSSM